MAAGGGFSFVSESASATLSVILSVSLPPDIFRYFSTMSAKINTSDSDCAQPAPGTVLHCVWEDSKDVATEKGVVSAPSVGPDVPGQEVSQLP